MIIKFQEFFKVATVAVIGSLVLWNCEPDADRLGSQFFQDGAQGTESVYPVIAYNYFNGDSVRSDSYRLQNATLGAFSEPQFGMQKSDYVTQVRLTATPDFGINPKLDSAILVIKPYYYSDSVATVTNEDYIFPKESVPAKMEIKSYPIGKYGKSNINGNTIFNIKVEEVTEFLASASTQVRSNRSVATGATIGAKTFDGIVKSIKVTKDTDNTVLMETPVGIRIPLDSTFITNKILTKANAPELSDAASFIRYMKGIKVSVEENDGYLMSFDPNSIELNLYYKHDVQKDGTTTQEAAVYQLNAGSANAHFNQIKYDRTNTVAETALATSNQMNGDQRIFAQGMGGPGIGLRIKNADIEAIRSLYDNEKIGIISAKIRIYTADEWTTGYAKPGSFVIRQRNLNPATGENELLDSFLEDISTLTGSGFYNLVRSFDLEKTPAHYDISITQTVKNIIEKGDPNYDLVVNVGTYTSDTSGSYIGVLNASAGAQNFTTRAYVPNRAIFVGTEANNPHAAQLILTYGKKQ